jgi:osmoprotectant transport system ATP-binding protein
MPQPLDPGKPDATKSANAFAIEMRDVGYRLPDGRLLLNELNLAIPRGQTLVLLGRSGSGKTTSLKLINLLLTPTAGQIFIDGRNQSTWDPIRLRRTIGYVIQDVGLFPHWTVERNVALVPRLEGWPEQRIRDRVREMLLLVGLDVGEFAARHARELSGGQRQRVGVARALAGDPPILLMDEPFGALDPITRAELQREFRSLAARLGKTIAFVTHDLREALLLGERIALLAAGRLVGVYSPQQFLRAQEPEVRAFVDSLEPTSEVPPKPPPAAASHPDSQQKSQPEPVPSAEPAPQAENVPQAENLPQPDAAPQPEKAPQLPRPTGPPRTGGAS